MSGVWGASPIETYFELRLDPEDSYRVISYTIVETA
jgi:hypothetical protein